MKCLSHIVVGAELPTNTQNKLIANFATQNGIELGFSLADRIEYPTSTIMAVRRFAEPGSHCLDPIITAYFPAAAELMAKLIPVFYCGEVRSDMMGISAENGDGLAEPKAEAKAEESLLTKGMTRRESIARRAAQMRDDGIDYGEIGRKLLGSTIGSGKTASGRTVFVGTLLKEYDGGAFDGKRYSSTASYQPGSDFLEKHAAYHAQVRAYFDDCLTSVEVAKWMAENHGVIISGSTAISIYHASRNGDFKIAPPAIEASDLPKQAELISTPEIAAYPRFLDNGDFAPSTTSIYSLASARHYAKIVEECVSLRKKGLSLNEISAILASKHGCKMSITTVNKMLAAHKAGMFNRI